MKKDFLQPNIEFVYLNDVNVLMNSFEVDNVVDFPQDPKKSLNNDL